uniref:Uncharacterized protein n=1 Tax=uncultured marine microorganism HF4000_APKG10F13 TaxID=455557 RepID=B3TBR5_9ZZZZ|nr:hypothetical protein ALOHA_HF4000APKG10F13ctg1g7 [uncultured marine microorganism HF4000_APKG10F13]
MGAPLRDDAALNGRSAMVARLTAATEDAQLAAEAPWRTVRACEVLDGCPPRGDGSAQDGADAPMQPPHFACGERVGGPQRVDASSVQRLVDIDVPEAGEEALVEQQRLQPRPTRRQHRAEAGGGESARERLGAEVAHHLAGAGDLPGAPELAHINEAEPVAAVEPEGGRRPRWWLARHHQPPGHAQVNDKPAAVEPQQQELAAAVEPHDAAAGDFQRGCRGARPDGFGGGEGAPHQQRRERTAAGFDFGKLRHVAAGGSSFNPAHPRTVC